MALRNTDIQIATFIAGRACGIQVVRTLAIFNKRSIGMILSKYAIPSLTVSVTDIKNFMWRHFVDVSYDKL